jgi:hypothetical protein
MFHVLSFLQNPEPIDEDTSPNIAVTFCVANIVAE